MNWGHLLQDLVVLSFIFWPFITLFLIYKCNIPLLKLDIKYVIEKVWVPVNVVKVKAFVSKQDQQNHKEVVKYEKKLLCDGKQHLTESLREKCFRIKVSAPF